MMTKVQWYYEFDAATDKKKMFKYYMRYTLRHSKANRQYWVTRNGVPMGNETYTRTFAEQIAKYGNRKENTNAYKTMKVSTYQLNNWYN